LTILLLSLCGVASAQSQPEVVFSDDFQSYGSPTNPPGWVDTAIGSSKPEAGGLFKTWPDPLQGNKATNIVFGSRSASGRPEGNNPRMGHFSTLTTKNFSASGRFEYRGRFLRTTTDSHIGFTFLSSYPEKDSYYLIGLWSVPGSNDLSMQLFGFGAGSITGTTNSGFTPAENVWYRFAIQVDDTNGATNIRARFWADNATEPATFSINAQDASATRLRTGRIGLWAAVNGANYFDDLYAKSPVDHTAPIITFLESGKVLLPNTQTEIKDVAHVDVEAKDDLSGVASLTVTRNGEPYTRLTPITIEGVHTLKAVAVDNVGNRSESETKILVDATPPTIVLTVGGDPLPPVARFKTIPAVDIVVDDKWTKYTSVATLDGQPYTSGTPISKPGPHTLTVTATDNVGHTTIVTSSILVDLGAPVIAFVAKGVTLTSPAKFTEHPVVTLALTDDFTRSENIKYTAKLENDVPWKSGEALPTGWNTISVTATDESGNSTSASQRVLVDVDAPTIVFADGTKTLDPAILALYKTDVVITITTADATSKVVDTRKLNGEDYKSGTLITIERKSHALTVRAEDEAGNVTQKTLSILLDKTAPTITFSANGKPADARELQKFKEDVIIAFDYADAISTPKLIEAKLEGETFTSPSPLTNEAPQTLRVVVEDETGNRTESSLRILFDKTPPVLTFLERDVVLDTTKETPFDRVAHVVVKATDALSPNLVPKTTLDGGDYTSGAPIATDGRHTIAAEVTDEAGNTTTGQVKILIDTTGPVVTFFDDTRPLDPRTDVEFRTKPKMVVDIKDAFSEFEKTLTLDGAPFTSGTIIEEGRHVLVVTARDVLKNETKVTYSFLVDVTPPVVVLRDKESNTVLPSSGAIFNRKVIVEAQVDDTSTTTKTMTVDGTEWTIGSPIVTEGERTVVFTAVDELDWSTSVTTKFIIDTTPPIVTVLEGTGANATPLQNGASFARNVFITATAEDITKPVEFTATIDGAPYTLGSEYSKEGSHKLILHAIDQAKNSAEPITLQFHIDKNAPEVKVFEIVEAKNVFKNDDKFRRDIKIDVDVTSATTPTTVITIDGATYTEGDVYSIQGEHVLKVVATNLANLSTTIELEFLLDKEPPTLKLFAEQGKIFENGLTFNHDITPFTVADDNLAKPPKVTVTLNGQKIEPGYVVTEDKNFHTISAVAEDNAGNTTSVGPFNFILDKKPPTVTIEVDGKPLKTGDKFNKAITPKIEAEDITDVKYGLTLNTRPYTRGTEIVEDDNYELSGTVTDALGNVYPIEPIKFIVDKTAPVVTIVHKESGEKFEGILYKTRVTPKVVIQDLTPTNTIATRLNRVTGEEVPWSTEQEISTDGHYTLKVTVTDDLGNTTVHPPIEFTIDQAAPEIIVTENNQPLLTNTIFNRDARPKIEVKDTTKVTVVATRNDQEFVSETLVTEEAVHVLKVKATDETNRTTEIQPITFTVDKSDPVVTVLEGGVVLTDNALLDHNAQIVVDARDLTLNEIITKVDGQPYVRGTTIIGDGLHTFDVTVTDKAGHSTTVPTIRFTIDTTPPVVRITESETGDVLATNDEFKETIAPWEHVQDISKTTTKAKLTTTTLAGVVTTREWTMRSPLPDEGKHVLEVIVTDDAGHKTIVPPIAFVIDKTAPKVDVFESNVLFTTGKKLNRPAELSIAIEDLTKTITDAKLTAEELQKPAATRDITFPATLTTDARYKLNVTVTDNLKQSTQVPEIAFVVDQTPPVVLITESGKPLVTGDAFNRPSIKPEITITDLTETKTTAILDGAPFTFGAEITEEGKHTLAASVTDLLEWKTDVPAITFYIDRTPPVVKLVEGPNRNDLVDGSWFNRDVVPYAQITDTTDTKTTATLNGKAYDMETPITAEGEYTLAVRVTDAVGLFTDVPPVKFTIDRTPPDITITFPAADAVVGTPQVVVVGDSDDAVTVTINDVPSTIDPAEKKYATNSAVELIEGENTLVAFGVDRAGNNATITQNVRLDTRAPELTVTSPLANACLDVTEVNVTGRVGDAALASVKVSAGGDPVNATIAADKKSFTAILPTPNEGKIVIRIEAKDASGHTATATVPVTIDRTKPVVEVTESGHPFTAKLVNRVLALYVRAKDADPAATVVVTLDGKPYTNGTPITADKTYELRAKATDCAGRVSDELVLQFTIDRTPPQITSFNPGSGSSHASKPAIAGTLSEPASVVSEATGTAANVSGVNFTYAGALSEGLNNFVFVATDAAGNQSRTPYAITVDTIAPSVQITENGDAIAPDQRFNRAVTPVITSNDPTATITATLNTANFKSGTTVDADGSYTITAKARDAMGNESATATATFRIDRSGPSIDITSPQDGSSVNSSTVAVTGNVAGNVKSVTVNNVLATVTGTTFAATIPLDLGSNLVTAIAIDQANQSATDSIEVTRNEASLTILLTAPPDKLLTNRPTTLVAGQVLNVPNTQKVTINGTDAAFDPAGAFRRLDHPLTEGENVITASATSKAGQVTSVTATVTADFTPPVVRVLANGTELLEGARFATSPSLTLEVTDNYPTGLTRKLMVDGEILNEVATSLGDGGHALTATARDQAGNETRVDRVFFVGAGGIGGGCALSNFTPAQNAAVFGEVVRITGRSGGAANVLINGKAATVADGTFCGDATLVPGRNDVTIQCADANGAPTSDQPATLVLYRYADPEIAITSPSNGATVTTNTITVTGTVGAGVDKVDVNGKQITLAPGTQTFSIADVPVKPGLNIFTARALTLSKRIAATSVQVKALTGAPQITITTPLVGTQSGQRGIDVGGTYANVEPNTITVSVNGASVPVTTHALTDTNGTFTASATIAANVKSTITASGRNGAGAIDTETTDVTHVSTLPFITITSPADTSFFPSTHTGTVRVTGTFGSEANLSVQVNGTLATVDGTTFHADVTLAESSTGVTPIIARVTAEDSRTATDAIRVMRFTAPLSVRQRFPEQYEDDAKVKHEAVNVDTGTMVIVLFNNPLDRASAQSAISVVDSKGAAVSGTVFVDRDAISFAPATPLRNNERYTATIATTLRDASGAALVAPYSFSFNTTASAPVNAPIIDDSITSGCFSSTVISGRINTPNGQVLIEVDGVPRRVNTSETGAFRTTITFDGGSGYHLVRIREIASDATLSSERAICYRITCAIPQVIGATLDRTQKKLAVQFSKPMDPTSLSASANGSIVIVPQGETALDGTVTMNAAGDLATVTLTSIPQKTILLTVKKSAKDTSGTPMSADYTQSFPFSDDPNAGRGDGYINGAVYDASNGRPLPSAVVEISGVTTKTTNTRGRYTHPMGEGAYTITAGAPNYTTVWRQVVVPAGAGVVPIDIRVTPRGNAVTTNGSAQKLTHGTTSKLTKKVELDLAAASLPSGRSIRLTAVGGQSLAGLLPLGWSPLASAEIVVDDTTNNVALPGAKLTFHIDRAAVVAANQTLTVAQYEPVRDEWRVLTAAATIEADGRVEAMIPSTGNYALVYADKAPLKVPATPRAGLPLDAADNVCAADPTQCQLTGEDFILDPQKVLPSGVTTATLTTKGDKSYPSGTAVQAFIDEQLNLADGRVLYDPPFATDLLIYRKLDGTKGVADFHLSPSAQAVGVILRDGVDHIRVVDYPGRLDRGTLIGAEGGRVPGDDGITLEIPAGATTEPLHASVSSIAANDLAAFGTFPGFRVASGFKVTLTRASDPTPTDGTQSFAAQLLTPSRATVSVANSAMPVANAQVIIAEVLPSTPYGTTARVVALTNAVTSIDVPDMKVFATRPIVSTQLPLDGIVREGSYLVLVAEQPIAYAYGQVRVADAAASRVRVSAGTGNPMSSVLGVRDLTRIDGLFVVPVAAKPAAPFSLVPRAPSTGDGATFVAGSSPDADTFVGVGILQLQAQPPKLTKIEPADNAQLDATDAVIMQATFSVAIDPTSVAGGLVLTNLNTRSVVPGTVALQGANIVRFTPATPISAATQYSLTVMPSIRGLNGAPFGRSAVSTFTTRAIPFNDKINRDLIKIEMPDANGKSKITGLAGAIPGGAKAVAIRRGRTFIEGYTVEANLDGSFTLEIGHRDPKDRITLADIIELQVLDRVSKGIIAMIRLTPFVKPDGRTFYVTPEVESRLVSPEGIVVIVPAGAFDHLTEIRIDAAQKTAFAGVPNLDNEINFISAVNLQFEGVSNKPLEVELPVPQGLATNGRTFILGRLGESVRGPRIEADDLLGIENGMFTTRETTATAGVRSVRTLDQPKSKSVKEYLLKVFAGAIYCVMDVRVPAGGQLGWAAMDGIQQGLDMFFSALQSLYVSNFYLTTKRGRVVAPMLTGVPFSVEGVDTATGMTEFTSSYDGINPDEPGGFDPLPSPVPNPNGPYPVFGKPFNIDIIDVPIANETLTPLPGFTVKLDGSSDIVTVTRTGTSPKTFTVVNTTTGSHGTNSGNSASVDSTIVGHRLVLASSADSVEPTRSMQIVFNEAINYGGAAANLKNFFKLEKDEQTTPGGAPIWKSVGDLVEFSADSGDRRVLMTLPGELQRGGRYRLEISGTLTDVGGTGGAKTLMGGTMHLPFEIRKPGGEFFDGTPVTLKAGTVRDIALDGNLLFISATDGGLQVYDTSDPASLDTATPHAYTVPIGDQWAIDIDHHGRIWTTALTGFYGIVRSFRVEDFYAGGEVEPKAAGIVSWRTGVDVGMPLGTTWVTLSDRVEAIPRRMQVLTQDDRIDETGGPDFVSDFAPNTLGASVSQTGTQGEFGIYSFTIPKSSPKFRVQRATVQNVTLGLRWSKDIKIYAGESNVSIDGVLIRNGDQVRITRNHSTYGAISLFGYGVGLFDLNAIETNHWHSNLPGPNFKQPGEQIMVTEARVKPACEEQNGLEGGPCPPSVMTFTADTTVVSGLDGAGNPLLNVLALEAAKGVRSVMVEPIQGSLEATGPDESPYGPLGAQVSFTDATTFTSRNASPPIDHPRLARIREAFGTRKLTGRFSTISRYDKVEECFDPATGTMQDCWRAYALVSGYQFGILVLDVSKPLNQESLVDVIWVPAGAVAVRVLQGTSYATAVDGRGRSLLIDLKRIDESKDVAALSCALGASPCLGELFPTVRKALEAGPGTNAREFGADDPRIIWKSDPTDGIAGSLAPVADPETGFMFKGELTDKTFRVMAGLDPNIAVKVDLGGGKLENVNAIVPLGINPPNGVLKCDPASADCRASLAVFRVETAFPAKMATSAMKLAVESEILAGSDVAQMPEPFPPAHIREKKRDGATSDPRPSSGFELRRVIDVPGYDTSSIKFQKGYNRFVTDWVIAIADARASKEYGSTDTVDTGCNSCRRPSYLSSATNVHEIFSAGNYFSIRPEFTLTGDYAYLTDPAHKRIGRRFGTIPSDLVRPNSGSSTIEVQTSKNLPVAGTSMERVVTINTGEVHRSARDLRLRGRALDPLDVTRYYTSAVLHFGMFGRNFDTPLEARVRTLPNGDVEFYDGTGRRDLFKYTAPHGYSPEGADVFVDMRRHATGSIIVSYAENRRLFFDSLGRLSRITDRNTTRSDASDGNVTLFVYDHRGRLSTVVDPTGRPFRFKYYDSSSGGGYEGLVHTVTDEVNGRTVTYRYDSAGRLERVTGPDPGSASSAQQSTEYSWDAAATSTAKAQIYRSGRIFSERDGLGRTVFTVNYDGTYPWAAKTVSIGGGSWTFNLNAGDTTVIDPLGGSWKYERDAQNRVTALAEPGGATTAYKYDGAGRVERITQPLGNYTTFSYGAAAANGDRRAMSLLTTSVEFPRADSAEAYSNLARTTTISYGPTHLPTLIKKPDGSTTTIVRDIRGNAQTMTDASGVTLTFTYDDFGLLRTVTDPRTGTQTYGYHTSGPKSGFLDNMTTSAGTVDIDVDARGNVTKTVDETGRATISTYNKLDQLESVTSGISATTYKWDAAGALKSESMIADYHPVTGDPIWSTTTYTHDELGRRKDTTIAGVTDTYSYDAAGNLKAKTPGNLPGVTYTYDDRHRLEVVNTAGSAITFAYDANDTAISETDAVGETTTVVANGFGQPIGEIDPNGLLELDVVDSGGRPIENRVVEKLADGSELLLKQSEQEFDDAGRLLRDTQHLFEKPFEVPDENRTGRGAASQAEPTTPLVTQWIYDDAARTVTVIDPAGHRSVTTKDELGRVVRVVDAAGNSIDTTYEPNGNKSTETVTELRPDGTKDITKLAFEYDEQNRLVRLVDVTVPQTPLVTEYGYDPRGNVISQTDPDGRTTRYKFDLNNRKVEEIAADGGVSKWTYDERGRVETFIDALQHVTAYAYDDRGNVVEEKRHDGAIFRYTYDAADRRVTTTDPNGTVVTTLYDDAGNVRGQDIAKGTGVEGPSSVRFTLDKLGRVTGGETDEGVKTAFTFDSLDRELSEQIQIGTGPARKVMRQYDAVGNVVGLQTPSGATYTFHADPIGRLSVIREGARSLASYTYSGSRVLQKTLGHGIAESWSYDPRQRLASITSTATNGAVVRGIGYARTPAGLKESTDRSDLEKRWWYERNKKGEVTREQVDRIDGEAPVMERATALTPDALLNYREIVRAVQDAGGTTEVSVTTDVNERNQYTRFGDDTLQYDRNGNLTRIDRIELRYDYENRLVRATLPDGTVVRNLFDADGRKVRQTVTAGTTTTNTDYVLDGDRVIEEYVDDKLAARHVHGRGIDEIVYSQRSTFGNGTLDQALIPLQDEHGNVDYLTGADGAPLERYEYDGYGTFRIFSPEGIARSNSSYAWRWLFHGREYSSLLSAYDFRARVLWPEIGRFGQEDPLGTIDSPNLYQAFLGAWPDATDPSGQEVERDEWSGMKYELDFMNFGPNQYTLSTGRQAHSAWQTWLQRWRSGYLGRPERNQAFYDIQVRNIASRTGRRFYGRGKKKPDAASLFNAPAVGRHRTMRIWELKPWSHDPKGYFSGGLSYQYFKTARQLDGYVSALPPAERGFSHFLNNKAPGDIITTNIGLVSGGKRSSYTMMAYSTDHDLKHSFWNTRGMVFYRLTKNGDDFDKQMEEQAELMRNRSNDLVIFYLIGRLLGGRAPGTVPGTPPVVAPRPIH
jgi:YD repeat-containing protein